MIRFTRSQVQPIGLDLGGDSIKLLQVETVGNGLAVVAAARQPLPDEVRQASTWQARVAASLELVRPMLRHGGFRGRSVIAALPREILHIKNLRMPVMPPPELTAAVQFEARNVFAGFDIDAAHVRHLPASEVRQGTDVKQEVILLAAPHAEVNAFLEQLHRGGLVVESFDAEPCALYRGVERFIRRREDEQDVNVLVDVGARRTQVIIGRGRDVSFYKPIEIGGNHWSNAVSLKLGITLDEARALRRRLGETVGEIPAVDWKERIEGGRSKVEEVRSAAAPFPPPATFDAPPAPPSALTPSARRDPVRQAVFDASRGLMEDLGREVSLCLRYFSVTFRGQRPNKVRLVGGEAGDPQLQAVLNTALTIPVEPGRPMLNVDASAMKPADRGGSTGEWALALGLGLKRTRGGFAPRDGKPRDAYAPHVLDRTEDSGGKERVEGGGSTVEEGKVVAAPLPPHASFDPPPSPPSVVTPTAAPPREIAHA